MLSSNNSSTEILRKDKEIELSLDIKSSQFINPLTIESNPAFVYIGSLAKNSRRTIVIILSTVVEIVLGIKEKRNVKQSQRLAMILEFPWHELTYLQIMAIRNRLEEIYAPATGNKALVALKQVLKQCFALGLIEAQAYGKICTIKPIKGSRPLKGRSLDKEEIEKLHEICRVLQRKNLVAAIRNESLLAFLRIGMRRSEIVSLSWKDIDLDSGEVTVIGKGNKYRSIYLTEKGITILSRWKSMYSDLASSLEIEAADINIQPIFVSIAKGGKFSLNRLSDQAVLTILNELRILAGLESFSPHDFRRTCVSDLLDAGVDIATVQKIAGHSSVETTARYDRRNDKAKKQAIDALN